MATNFTDVLNSSRPMTIKRLVERAALCNRLAKNAPSPSARAQFYDQKTAAISRLLLIGAGRVEELLVTSGLITVALPGGRRLHVPVGDLLPAAKHEVDLLIRRRLTEL